MKETYLVLLIQIITITILFIALWHIIILFLDVLKRQINSNKQFYLEHELLQNKINQQILKANHILNLSDNTWKGFRKFTIEKKQYEQKSGICSFYLIPHDRLPIPSFKPGQHIFIRAHIPGQSKPLLRCYSISNSPSITSFYRISIKKALPPLSHPIAPPGIVSSYFYDNLKQGDIVDVRAPSGHFYIDLLSHHPIVLIAAGIGITPIISMLSAVCDTNSQREIWFFLTVQNKQNHIMKEHLQQIKENYDNAHIHICYSRAGSDDIQGVDYDHSERASVELLSRILPSNNFDFYFCGPENMIKSFISGLSKWNVPSTKQHYELFKKPSIQKSIESTKNSKTTATIEFSKSKKSCSWSETGDSILDLALSNEVSIDYSCRRGMCGLCQTTIKSGTVYYDESPEFLPELEQGMCLPCVAKTKKDLELYA